ncbi:MAG: 50S ribosomal protein L6 [Thermoflexales bacterium]|nr:50S ribosomal protein L6 [Thermoflexales bacterium]MCS7324621.1 50S ribosomal protein L6 [Thermoflexales bacterium]MCX7937990.1 50S ribosomal protein L6 [Thermoflexales bacterium]MDW8053832.1 50S ribosomal protein L6 [Anaerolineae bacterium]MDW8292363.1 50S ribosomal protein L6 [Anaerolineae bacterium]
MSRIGRKPIELPKGVDVVINGSAVTVKGPKGELQRTFDPRLIIEKEGNTLVVKRTSDDRQVRALHGLTRALLNNMVIGVSQGYQKVLEITAESVGYRAEMAGKNLMLYLGYSHPIQVTPPPGITFSTDPKTRTITVSGIDKELVGEVAAQVRRYRPPEPYKGKGIRYINEVIRRKAGKAGKTGKGK